MSRPHIQQLTDNLKALATSNWDDIEILRSIREELDHRERQRARNLLEEIDQRIVELEQEDEGFAWPTTDASGGDGGLIGDVFRHSSGLLRYMDYKVGATGYNEGDRRDVLKVVYEERLPNVNSREYMAEWGRPKSSQRLQKMAESIASFTRNAKRQSFNDMSMAIDEWEADLVWLKRRYYDGKYDFVWPHTEVGE
jgi:hypothetical protein